MKTRELLKAFFLGAWVGAALLSIIYSAINGDINIWVAAWGAFTFAGWVVLTKNAGKA